MKRLYFYLYHACCECKLSQVGREGMGSYRSPRSVGPHDSPAVFLCLNSGEMFVFDATAHQPWTWLWSKWKTRFKMIKLWIGSWFWDDHPEGRNLKTQHSKLPVELIDPRNMLPHPIMKSSRMKRDGSVATCVGTWKGPLPTCRNGLGRLQQMEGEGMSFQRQVSTSLMHR